MHQQNKNHNCPVNSGSSADNDRNDQKDSTQLHTAYQAVLSMHNEIADFRSKLLALLPIATGAGIFFLIKNISYSAQQHLPAIGLSGILVTVGLFLYELKNIQKCRTLIVTGKLLEEKILGADYELGAFHGGRITDAKSLDEMIGHATACADSAVDNRQTWKRKYVSNTWAGMLVYATVIAGWTYLAAFGSASYLWHNFRWDILFSLKPFETYGCLSLSAAAMLVTIWRGNQTNKKYKATIDKRYCIRTDVKTIESSPSP